MNGLDIPKSTNINDVADWLIHSGKIADFRYNNGKLFKYDNAKSKWQYVEKYTLYYSMSQRMENYFIGLIRSNPKLNHDQIKIISDLTMTFKELQSKNDIMDQLINQMG